METLTPNNSIAELWQVDAGGEIYQGSFDELTQWIAEGVVLPQDKVRRGNLRWIEANKVPNLHKFFNAQTIPPVITTNSPKPFPNAVSTPIVEQNQAKFCLVHIETEAKFLCGGCANFFCKECPNSFGASVKVCPMCGGMCQPLEKAVAETRKAADFQRRINEGFGFRDFGRAFAYPFKYPASFIFGALFYGFFTVASQASAIGGIFLLTGSILCWMLANMLTFGILSNTVENMLQGRLDENFMPGFDNFNLWDDALHPFFLNISVYLSSFGLLIILSLAMIFFVANSIKTDSSTAQKAVQTVAPETAADFSEAGQADKQINAVKEAVKRQNEHSQKQFEALEERKNADQEYVESVENGQNSSGENPKEYTAPVMDEEQQFQQMNEMINQTRQAQLESAVGKPTEDEQIGISNLYQKVLLWGGAFILLAGIAFIWGIFYLPVALIVAAYTRNIGSVFNPAIGLDTIKRLGIDYVKILLMGFVLLLIGSITSFFLNIIFAPFNLPRLGNIPVIAVGSIFTFYLSIVFSVVLGYALYKNSDKFPLFKTI